MGTNCDVVFNIVIEEASCIGPIYPFLTEMSLWGVRLFFEHPIALPWGWLSKTMAFWRPISKRW